MPEFTISAEMLSSLINNLAGLSGGRPDPNGPEPDPLGPLGPISYAALNAQPIPPRGLLAQVLAAQLIERVGRNQELAQVLPDEASASVQRLNERLLTDFDGEWCGTPHGQVLPPPKRKILDDGGLLLMGAALYGAREIHPQLGELGMKLLGTGLERLGTPQQ